MLRRLTAVVLVGVAAGCTRTLQIQVVSQPNRGTLAARAETCAARLYAQNEAVPASCTEVGDVFVGDTGWTVDCGAARVRDEIRRQACLFGADAVQVIREREPSFFESSCDQVRARFLACPHPSALGTEAGR